MFIYILDQEQLLITVDHKRTIRKKAKKFKVVNGEHFCINVRSFKSKVNPNRVPAIHVSELISVPILCFSTVSVLVVTDIDPCGHYFKLGVVKSCACIT